MSAQELDRVQEASAKFVSRSEKSSQGTSLIGNAFWEGSLSMSRTSAQTGDVRPRHVAILVGGAAQMRAAICHATAREDLHVEPVGTVGELTLRDLTTADVLLVWDDGEIIEQLKCQLSIIGCWSPIVAISEMPSARRVVRAMLAGAIDYVDWAGDPAAVWETVSGAIQIGERIQPLRQRQMRARRQLNALTGRERQVLLALAQGMSNKEIASELRISHRTVEIHRANMMHKVGAMHTADAIRLAIEASLAARWVHRDGFVESWSIGDLLRPQLESLPGGLEDDADGPAD